MKEFKYKLPFDGKRRMGYFAFAVFNFALAMAYLTYHNYAQDVEFPWFPLLPLLGVPVLAYFYWRSLSKYDNVFVIIRINDETIHTAAPALFDVTIHKTEVLAIHELPSRSLIVTKDAKNRILVPHYMDGYPEVREVLSSWSGLVPVKSLLSFVNFYRIFPVVVFLVGLIGNSIFRSGPLYSFFVAFCIVGGLHTFYILHKLNSTVPQIARARWFVLIMVLMTAIRAYGVYMVP
jgi:hypothetical protein